MTNERAEWAPAELARTGWWFEGFGIAFAVMVPVHALLALATEYAHLGGVRWWVVLAVLAWPLGRLMTWRAGELEVSEA